MQIKNIQFITFAQILTLLFEMLGRDKKMLQDDFWIEMNAVLKVGEENIKKLLSKNNRNISFSNIILMFELLFTISKKSSIFKYIIIIYLNI